MLKSEFYYSLLNKFSIVAITNSAGIITYVNEKFCEISEYSESELIGQSHNIVKSGYHTRSFYKGLWKCIAAGEVWRGEICNKAKNGGLYWVDTFIIPELDSEGKVIRYYSIRIDISKRKRTELEIYKQKQDLERIALMQSHQVRKPVANVIGLIDLLDTSDLSEANIEVVKHLKESAKELELSIKDIVKKAQ